MPMSLKRYSIEELIKASTIASFAVSKDSSKLMYSSDDRGHYDVYQVHLVNGEKSRLTEYDENALVKHVFDDGSFLFMMDRGGNELHHLYLNRGGEVVDLTPVEGTKSGFHQFSGGHVYYFSNRLDKTRFDLYRLDRTSLESELIFENKEAMDLGPVSDDGRYVGLSRQNTANDSEMFIYDRSTGDTRYVSRHTGDAKFLPVFFSKDSTELYYLTDEIGEFMALRAMKLDSLHSREVLTLDWDIFDVERSQDGRYAALVVNRDSFFELQILDLASDEVTNVRFSPGGMIYQQVFDRNSKRVFALADSAVTPTDIHVLSIGDGEVKTLTNSANAEVESDDLVTPTILRFSSYDGTIVPGVFYVPADASPEKKVPALIWVHGGPGGQSYPRYNPELQFLVNHGYAVYAVNNRGSSGYGKSFFKAADHKHGEADLDDCVAAARHLATMEEIDGDRIGIIGGSYGGYMVLAALAFRPKVFKVGVDIFGVSNWVRTLKEIPPWWRAIRDLLYRKIGDPFSEEEYLRSISPLFHASKIERPLLVLQGVNDPRVLKVESDEIVQKARENGVPTGYIVFDDEGHGFTRKVNRITAAKAMLEFLDRYLV